VLNKGLKVIEVVDKLPKRGDASNVYTLSGDRFKKFYEMDTTGKWVETSIFNSSSASNCEVSTSLGGYRSSAKIVDFYTDLEVSPEEGCISFVLYSSGTKWLPGSLGGTYYPSGWYMFLGSVWVSDSKFIDEQLNQNEGLIANNTSSINNHLIDLNNPHQVNKTDVGLGDVDNTSDLNKPISTANQTALNSKAGINHTHLKADITDFNETDYGTAAEGILAGTSLQPGDNISQLFNDQVYLQPSDNVSALTNDAGYIVGNTLTLYRSDVDGSIVYSGYLLNSIITIKKCDDGLETFGQSLTDLEAGWTNRLNLTYV
tara:strand:+ start:21186 stop:22133 length:948 start_codon:yes stop_codon:yes gene_type:complete